MNEVFDIQSLKDLGDGDLALHAENMADLLEDHAAYKGQTIPPCIPGPVEIREDAGQVKQTSTAARHDPSKEPERLAARDKVIQSIRFSCQYVVMFSAHVNDPSHLDTIGMDRASRAPRSWEVRAPRKIEKFTASHGGKSGEVRIYVNSWEGKASVQIQVCYADPGTESSWQNVKISQRCRSTLEGLEPARRAYFRARLVNDAGNGPWSEVVQLIII